MSVKTIRCTDCAVEFTDSDVIGHSSCPACGNKGIPCAISEDVTIRINWHELRILGCWAERWAEECAKNDEGKMCRTLAFICERIEKQFPDKTPLTLTRELRQLPLNVQVFDTAGNLKLDHKGGNKA